MGAGAGDGGGSPTGAEPGGLPTPASPRRATLGDLLAELRRRRVFRVMVAYAIFAFAVLQVVEPIMHGAHLPEWVLTVVLVALAVGFPVALSLAWLFDLTAQGVMRTPSAAGAGGIYFSRRRLAALLVAVALVGALPGLGWYLWKQAGERELRSATAGATTSIAVLPFADMSPGRDQEYFADGMAEEILNALAQVDGLRVPGRTSSFWFKGKEAKLADIGRELNVTHVLEGSVRRSGSRLRVTAQVVKVADGYHLWGDTFDRDQADIFAVQDQVARAVVEALKVKLLAGTSGRPKVRPTSIEAYDQYLIGRRLLADRSPASIRGAREAFERTLALDPEYAPAHAGLAQACRDSAGLLSETLEEVDRFTLKGLASAERAIAMDPNLADGYVARADHRLSYYLDWYGSLADLEKAIALGSRDAGAMRVYSYTLAALDRMHEALTAARRGIEHDPLSSGIWSDLAMLLCATGDFPGAEAAARRCLQASPDNPICGLYLGMALLGRGKPEEAVTIFEKNAFPVYRLDGLAISYHRMGQSRESRAALDELVMRYPLSAAYQVAEVHAFRGETDAAFDWLERARLQHDGGLKYVRFDPQFQAIHPDARWKLFLKKLNLPVD